MSEFEPSTTRVTHAAGDLDVWTHKDEHAGEARNSQVEWCSVLTGSGRPEG